MKERELGSMQIANERIRVLEKEADSADPVFVEYLRLQERQLSASGHVHKLVAPLCMWWAYVDDKTIVGHGALLEADGFDEVRCQVFVSQRYRRFGIGRFMARLGTDQAIRYRKRTILAEVENTNETALKILDEEDFEKQPEQHPGFTLMKKELKWV